MYEGMYVSMHVCARVCVCMRVGARVCVCIHICMSEIIKSLTASANGTL